MHRYTELFREKTHHIHTQLMPEYRSQLSSPVYDVSPNILASVSPHSQLVRHRSFAALLAWIMVGGACIIPHVDSARVMGSDQISKKINE